MCAHTWVCVTQLYVPRVQSTVNNIHRKYLRWGHTERADDLKEVKKRETEQEPEETSIKHIIKCLTSPQFLRFRVGREFLERKLRA